DLAPESLETDATAGELLLLAELDFAPELREALARKLLVHRRGVLWPTLRESALATEALLAHAARDRGTAPRELVLKAGKRELARKHVLPPELASLALDLDGRALAAIGRNVELVAQGG